MKRCRAFSVGAKILLTSRPLHQRNSGNYRPDIDGLRAVAVATVVLYHAFPTTLKGGFIGVDVFFVISGFLISSIILGGLETGKFTVADFYMRRIRRILPALLVVLMSVLIFGYFVLVQDEYIQLGKHLMSATLFLSNITLYQESGYFDLSSETKPLLHLWSLGVEEQFYLIWPLVVTLFWRRRLPMMWLIVGLGMVSFVANMVLVRNDPSAAFFWPVTRFWELMGGCVLAHVMRTSPMIGFSHLRGVIGLLLIVAAAVAFNEQIPYPGWAAIIPVTGAMLVISAGQRAWTNRYVLSVKPMVYLGLVSYPLYLWHWSLLSYGHIIEDRTPVYTIRLYLLAASVVLACATYLLVEKPIRFGRPRDRTHWLVGGLAMVGVLGLTAYTAPGALNRNAFAPAIANQGDIGHEEIYQVLQDKYFPCEPGDIRAASGKWKDIVRCFQTKRGAPTAALIGDSHAEQLLVGMAEANPTENIVNYIRSAPPTIDNPQARDVMQHVLQTAEIHKVVLTWYWRGDKLLVNETQMIDTVQAFKAAGKDVYIVEDGPWFPFYPHRCKYTGATFRGQNRCDESPTAALANQAYYTGVLSAGERAGAHVIRTADLFCTETACSMAVDGKLMFRDRHHLNINGSRLIGTRLSIKGASHEITTQPGYGETALIQSPAVTAEPGS